MSTTSASRVNDDERPATVPPCWPPTSTADLPSEGHRWPRPSGSRRGLRCHDHALKWKPASPNPECAIDAVVGLRPAAIRVPRHCPTHGRTFGRSLPGPILLRSPRRRRSGVGAELPSLRSPMTGHRLSDRRRDRSSRRITPWHERSHRKLSSILPSGSCDDGTGTSRRRSQPA